MLCWLGSKGMQGIIHFYYEGGKGGPKLLLTIYGLGLHARNQSTSSEWRNKILQKGLIGALMAIASLRNIILQWGSESNEHALHIPNMICVLVSSPNQIRITRKLNVNKVVHCQFMEEQNVKMKQGSHEVSGGVGQLYARMCQIK